MNSQNYLFKNNQLESNLFLDTTQGDPKIRVWFFWLKILRARPQRTLISQIKKSGPYFRVTLYEDIIKFHESHIRIIPTTVVPNNGPGRGQESQKHEDCAMEETQVGLKMKLWKYQNYTLNENLFLPLDFSWN